MILTHYDPSKEIVVAADASSYGLGACIMHKFPDGTLKPIYHASRSLLPAEKAYSQIEKEALALIFAVKKFHKMIFGRHFTLQSDHKPLLAIFGKKSGIPVHTANRLQRWAVTLLAYDFKIEYVSTNSFSYADALSRLLAENSSSLDEEYVIATMSTETQIKAILNDTINKLPVNFKMIVAESNKDEVLIQVKQHIENSWKKFKNQPKTEIQQFHARKSGLAVSNDCIMYCDRIVIPKTLRTRVLKQFHKHHPGIDRMKALMRSYVFWPNMDDEIVECVRQCNACALAAKSPTKTLLQSWPVTTQPWQRVHIDYAGPIKNTYYLLIIDSFSKWPEIVETNSITTIATIDILRDVFARYGSPVELVSDNGTQFTSSQFKYFCEVQGIKHTYTSPYHPMSNGQAERFVDTLKRSFKKLQGEGDRRKENLALFLQRYRATPNRYTLNQSSPAELFLGRKLRLDLDLLKPITKIPSLINVKQNSYFNNKHGAKSRLFMVNDRVFAKTYQGNHFTWEPGQVKERIGRVMYRILLDNGKIIRSHTNQLRTNYGNQPQQQDDILSDLLNEYTMPIPTSQENCPTLNINEELENDEAVQQATSSTTLRPTRQVRLPQKFADFVLYN